MSYLLIGNILAAIGESLFIASSASFSKKHTMIFQTAALVSIASANFILGGIGGAVLNLLGIIRNLLFLNEKTGLSVRIGCSSMLIIATLAACYVTGFSDMWFWLPLIANVLYTLCGHLSRKKFKIMCAINFALWLPYDILIGNFVSAIADGTNIILSIRNAVKKTENMNEN